MTPEQGAAIQAGAQLTSQGINAYAAAKMSKKDRKFSEHMYERQYDDNLAMWNMQNEYNSPTSAMNRLKQAGLNPNLVYGATAPGNASSSPQSPSVMNMGPAHVPKIDIGQAAGSVMSTYFDIQMKQAQIDNLKADNTIKKEQAALMWTQNLLTSTRNTRERSAISNDLLNYDNNKLFSAEERRLRIESTKKDIDSKTLSNRYNEGSLGARIKSVELGNKLRENQDKIQQYEMALNSMGFHKGDDMYSRLLAQFIKQFTGYSLSDIPKF